MLRSRMTVMVRRTVVALVAGVAVSAAAYFPTDAMAFGGHGGGGMGGFHGGMGGFHGAVGHFGGNGPVGGRFVGNRFVSHRFVHHRVFARPFFGPGLAFGDWGWGWGDNCWVWTPYGYQSVCY